MRREPQRWSAGPTRRELLRWSGLAALSGALPSWPAVTAREPAGQAETAGDGPRVLVVGAGLAGLTAAEGLLAAGFQVTVLEARLRPGGRVHTVRAPFADGLYAEAGAARIPGNHRRVIALAERFDLELVPFLSSEGDSVDLVRGRRVRTAPGSAVDLALYPWELSPAERAATYRELLSRYLGPPVQAVGDPSEAGWPPPELARWDRLSLAGLAREVGASPDFFRHLVLGTFEVDGEMSALYLLYLIALGVGGGPLFKIVGGNDRLPAALAAELADHVRYGTAVERIEQGEGWVRAVCRRGGEREVETADRLVCTAPFAVLRRLEIDPPLSAAKRRAVAELPYESSVRGFVQVGRRYWRSEGLSGFGRTDLPSEVWHPTHDQPGPRGLLQAYVKGRAGARWTAMEAVERRRALRRHVGAVLPGLGEHAEGARTVSWADDPWAGGSYSVYDRGDVLDLFPHVATPEGRVHFAGDHTSSLPGWMEGAVESGERAAAEVVAAERGASDLSAVPGRPAPRRSPP